MPCFRFTSIIGFLTIYVLCNIFPDSTQKDALQETHTPLPCRYFPNLRSAQDTGRGKTLGEENSRVWKRRWLKPGSAGAVLGTIVECDTAGQCEAEILPGMAEWAHSVGKDNSLLAIFYSPAQKLQP